MILSYLSWAMDLIFTFQIPGKEANISAQKGRRDSKEDCGQKLQAVA
jgi:hypothetical protein